MHYTVRAAHKHMVDERRLVCSSHHKPRSRANGHGKQQSTGQGDALRTAHAAEQLCESVVELIYHTWITMAGPQTRSKLSGRREAGTGRLHGQGLKSAMCKAKEVLHIARATRALCEACGPEVTRHECSTQDAGRQRMQFASGCCLLCIRHWQKSPERMQTCGRTGQVRNPKLIATRRSHPRSNLLAIPASSRRCLDMAPSTEISINGPWRALAAAVSLHSSCRSLPYCPPHSLPQPVARPSPSAPSAAPPALFRSGPSVCLARPLTSPPRPSVSH